MDRLTAMRYFARVVENGSFSEAARRVGKSKALLSKYVLDLEDELGARLLNRTTRRLSLTEVGEVYYDRALQLLQDFDDLEASVREVHSEPRGRLRVTAPRTFGEMHLLPAIARFAATYAEVELEVNFNDRFVDIVDEGFDVALRVADLPDSSLVARRLRRIRIVVCATPDYLRKHEAPEHPSALVDHVCVIDTNFRSGSAWQFDDRGRRLTVPVAGQLRVNSPLAARELVLAGIGIGLCPSFVVEAELEQRQLIPLLESFETYDYGLFALYPHRRHLSTKVRLFVDHLVEQFAR